MEKAISQKMERTMEESGEQGTKFYSRRAISIATYFGGPIAAGYLVKKNYEAMGQPEHANKALIIGIVLTLLILAVFFSIPEQMAMNLSNLGIPLIYTVIVYWIVERLQGEAMKKHEANGGTFYSGWKAAGIGSVAMLMLFTGFLVLAYITGKLSNQPAFDDLAYYQEAAKFVDNENKAMAVFDALETLTTDELINELENNIVLWEENIEIVHRMNAIENLPEELLEKHEGFLRYCELRIRHNKIMIKATSENTDQYYPEIVEIGNEINQIVTGLAE